MRRPDRVSGKARGAVSRDDAGHRIGRSAWIALGLAAVVSVAAAIAVIGTVAPGETGVQRAAELLDQRGAKVVDDPRVSDALLRSPLDATLVRSLALAVGDAGDAARATRLMQIAGDLSWRDSPTQVWLLEQQLRAGRYEQAVEHADALLRRRVELGPVIYPALVDIAGKPAGAKALAVRLAPNPDWRYRFLASLVSLGDEEARLGMYRRLQASANPPTGEEAGMYMRFLLQQGRYPEIRRVLATLRPAGQQRRAFVNDGAFTGAQGVPPFAWQLMEDGGGTVALEPSPRDEKNQALHIYYDGRSSTRLIWQNLLLPPGTYRFGVDAMVADQPRMARLNWVIRCLGSNAAILTAPMADKTGWARGRSTFEVPASGCEAQNLELEATPGEFRESLEFWYDNLAITPVGKHQ